MEARESDRWEGGVIEEHCPPTTHLLCCISWRLPCSYRFKNTLRHMLIHTQRQRTCKSLSRWDFGLTGGGGGGGGCLTWKAPKIQMSSFPSQPLCPFNKPDPASNLSNTIKYFPSSRSIQSGDVNGLPLFKKDDSTWRAQVTLIPTDVRNKDGFPFKHELI